ncbi:MAG: ClpXP protease specificity-enhancing factor [Rhodocyclaceae bacterium]|jgi:stringent starvation protein B|nr:ClpXP protease specificity-enhancing factor [Rhodocyclaceae bacterium]
MSVSTKPYLVRAIYEWCVDQGYTPYLAAVVDENVRVPPGYAKDGQIVLNLSPDATNQMALGNDRVTFQARFNGAVQSLSIPIANVVAVYARENGHGMAFEFEGGQEDPAEEDPSSLEPQAPNPNPPSGGRSHLKIIK